VVRRLLTAGGRRAGRPGDDLASVGARQASDVVYETYLVA
jgi:hypothetical protein